MRTELFVAHFTEKHFHLLKNIILDIDDSIAALFAANEHLVSLWHEVVLEGQHLKLEVLLFGLWIEKSQYYAP